MTDLSPLTSATEAQARANADRVGVSTNDTQTDTDFDEFLTLLTAQLENQDPLNPMDGTEFVEQLATFSSLEQQVETNELLGTLVEQDTSVRLAELAGWIGQEVQAVGVGVAFNGDPIEIEAPGDPEASRASVVIRDENGREIATLPADPDGETITWDGKTTSGGTAANGVYNIEFVYGFGEVGDPEAPPSQTVPAEAFGRVREARLDQEGGILILENGQLVSPDAITAVRTPDPTAAQE